MSDLRYFTFMQGIVRPNLSGDSGCGDGMVAGDHLDPNACSLAGAHRFYSLFPRWINHALQTKKYQPMGDITVIDGGGIRWDRQVREGQHWLTIAST